MGKQVKTPRFYVDIPTFLHATGETQWGHGGHHINWGDGVNFGGAELLYLNPSNPHLRKRTPSTSGTYAFKIGQNYGESEYANPKVGFAPNFCALLNHNLGTDNAKPYIRGRFMKMNQDYPNDSAAARQISSSNILDYGGFTEVLNFNNTTISDDSGDSDRVFTPNYNGTSIATWDTPGAKYWTTFEVFYLSNDMFDGNWKHQLGSLVIGRYWDAPHNPDLKLTMSRRFDGIKKQKTIGGKTLANIYYDGPTEWTMNRSENESYQRDWDGANVYKYPPFELDSKDRVHGHWTDGGAHFDQRVKSGLGRKGLKSWKLSFSFISEDDMWVNYENSNSIVNDTTPSEGTSPMLSDNSFNFVWNCTLGGTLPFIFQPDNSNNNPDQFAICTFKQNSLSVKQVAHNVYSLNVTIDEVA